MSEDYRNSIQENLKRGTTDMVILYLLSKEDMYGYQLNQKITELSKNRIVIKEGCLYPPVYRMESKGFLCKRKEFSACSGNRRYIYIQGS